MSEKPDGCGFVFFLILLIFGGCIYDVSQREIAYETIKPIQRVFLHDLNHVSFFVGEGPNFNHVDIDRCDSPRFIADVPEGKPMWAKLTKRPVPMGSRISEVEIHIHTVKDVEGGEWNHGKFGKGHTNVVE